MSQLKPKERHERLLADADKEKIVQHLQDGQEQDVTKIAVKLARQCNLFVHFQRLWMMRVSDLDAKFSSEQYTRKIYMNKGSLHKELMKPTLP
jgi:hypothetical protein